MDAYGCMDAWMHGWMDGWIGPLFAPPGSAKERDTIRLWRDKGIQS